MNKPFFSGVCTALVTPFLDGKVNFPMMERLLARQIDAGIPAVVICGTTGESPTLTDTEKIELFRRSKSYAGNSIKIIAGTGSNCTAHSVALSKAAQDVGVDGILCVAPYYNKSTPDGLITHYRTIAENTDIPMILYNVPSRTGVDIPVSVYQRLSLVKNIVGVKEAGGDITKVARIRRQCSPDFHVWSGNDDQIVPVLSLGGQGVISVLSNICPEETKLMVDAGLDGDFDTASALQCQLLPLIDLLFCEVNPIPVKAAMKLIGFDCGDCRLPLCDLTSENAAKLKKYLLG